MNWRSARPDLAWSCVLEVSVAGRQLRDIRGLVLALASSLPRKRYFHTSSSTRFYISNNSSLEFPGAMSRWDGLGLVVAIIQLQDGDRLRFDFGYLGQRRLMKPK